MTPKPVLVGFDGSDESRDALALGCSLARWLDAQLVVGAVLDYFPQDHVGAAVDSFERAMVEDRERLLEAVRDELGAGAAEFDSVLAMSAAHGLEVLADEHAAEIVVVGSTHRGPIGRVALGSMAERLLSGSSSAVAIAPRGYATAGGAPDGLREIGLAYDDSPEAHIALGVAAGIAAAAGSRLTLLRVIQPWVMSSRIGPGGPIPIAETAEQLGARKEAAERSVERALERITPEVEAGGDVEVGTSHDVLTRRAAQFDLLVLGSRGYGPARRVLLGSVSSKVARSAESPVLIVPRGQGEDDEGRHRVLRATGEAAVGLVPLGRS